MLMSCRKLLSTLLFVSVLGRCSGCVRTKDMGQPCIHYNS